jgi:hypothetical protein
MNVDILMGNENEWKEFGMEERVVGLLMEWGELD